MDRIRGLGGAGAGDGSLLHGSVGRTGLGPVEKVRLEQR